MIQLVGISGKICSGKTTMSEALIDKYGYKRVSLATPIKAIGKWYKDYSTGVLDSEDDLIYILREALTRDGDFTFTVNQRVQLAKDFLMYDLFPQFRGMDWSVEKNNDIRALYQDIGTRMQGVVGSDVWPRAMLQRIKQDQANGVELFVCDDVRFKPEYTLMKDFGFKIIRLEITPEVQLERVHKLYGNIEPQKLIHISETILDDVPDFDLVVSSNDTVEETLAEIIKYID